jgi:hypothetical protein
VRRRWRLTVIVRAAHAWGGVLIQLGLDPIETLGHLSDQPLGLLVVPFDQVSRFFMIRLDAINHLAMFLLNQRNQPLAFCHHQIDYVTTPVLSFLREPLLKLLLQSLRDPQIEPLDQVKGPLKAGLVSVVHLLPSSW